MLRTTIAALALCTVSANVLAGVVYSDGIFNNTDWGFEVVNVGTGGSANATQSLATGNPGAARRVTITTGNAVGDGTYAIHRFGTTNATRYVASTQGVVQSVNMSIDARFITGTFFGAGQGVYAQVKQGSNIYVAGLGVTTSSGSWVTFSASGVLATDFIQISGTATPLDFSASGAPMRFGFASANGNGGSPYSTTVDYDNFQLEVVSIPAPAASALAMLGITTLLLRRRTYHRA